MDRFPSPKGGGPIEAVGYHSVIDQCSGDFHRRKAVAPLKHGIRDHVPPVDDDFHRRKAVAPLKLACPPPITVCPGQISIAERRWPH